jgi:hypothetical protein
MTPRDTFNYHVDKPVLSAQGGRQHMFGQLGVNSIPSLAKDVPGRIQIYSGRRDATLGKAMVLLQVARDREENLPPGSLSRAPALPQTIQGNKDWHGCHTVPTWLTSSGHPLSIAVRNLAVKRYISMVFGDCMLMPKEVNRADKLVDDLYGIGAFVDAANLILRDKTLTARDGVQSFFDDAAKRLDALGLVTPADCVMRLMGARALNPQSGRMQEESAQSAALKVITIESHVEHIRAARIPEKEIANFDRLVRTKAYEAATVDRSDAET